MSNEQTPETTKPTRTQPPVLVEYRSGPTEPWALTKQIPSPQLSHAGMLAEIRNSVAKGAAPLGEYRLVREYRRVQLTRVETVSIEMDDLESPGANG